MKAACYFLITISAITALCCHQSVAPTVQRGSIQAGGFNIYYERQGQGKPLLLLHAGLQDHTMWQDQVKPLSGQYDIITIDLPYHGATTGKDTNLLIQDILRVVLDSLKVTKTSIAGLSLGAGAAEDFVIAYPERVNKAIFISSGLSGYDKVHPLDSVSIGWYHQMVTAMEGKDTAAAAAAFAKAWAEGPYRSGDSLKKPVSQFTAALTLKHLRQHQMNNWLRFKQDPPAYQTIAGIHLPVLIIHGDKDMPFITSASQYMEQQIPGAKRVLLKNVAHMLNMEVPVEVNKLIVDFLQ